MVTIHGIIYSMALRLLLTLSARLVFSMGSSAPSCDVLSIISGSSSVSGTVFLARLVLDGKLVGVAVGVDLGVTSIEGERDAGIP